MGPILISGTPGDGATALLALLVFALVAAVAVGLSWRLLDRSRVSTPSAQAPDGLSPTRQRLGRLSRIQKFALTVIVGTTVGLLFALTAGAPFEIGFLLSSRCSRGSIGPTD